ncbi:hypothetical protein JVU11DRAFT_8483 [Chiua virens]|nr:hypothetical protein JVU11DRAFT_8483 [Chiua virens]
MATHDDSCITCTLHLAWRLSWNAPRPNIIKGYLIGLLFLHTYTPLDPFVNSGCSLNSPGSLCSKYPSPLSLLTIMQVDTPPPFSIPRLLGSDTTLMYVLDFFIAAIILVFALFNIPRTLVYIANHGIRVLQGHLLHSTTRFRIYRYPSGSGSTVKSEKEPGDFDIPALESPAARKRPWHFPAYLSLRHPAASFLQYRALENYTILQVLLMVGYTAAVLFAAFYHANPFAKPSRAGFIITSQIPFVYAFATKNNVVGCLVGVGYEKLNYLHRLIGRLMIIGANVHAIGYVYKWTVTGTFLHRISQPWVVWGLIALGCFDLLGFFSTQYFRTKSYNLFFSTHAIGLIVALVAVGMFPSRDLRPFCVIAASSVYALDRIIRVIKTRFATATIRSIPELGLTRVDIPSLNSGWRPGQHVRLRVLSTAIGFFGMFEVHPFTIASATDTEEGLVLMCKRTGRWTEKLYDISRESTFDRYGQSVEKRIKVMVEGPYGGIGNVTIPNFSGAMFVVGGSGITFALSAVQDLILASAKSRTEVIEVIWSIPHPGGLDTFIPLFTTLLSQIHPGRLNIRVFYTRASSYSHERLVLPRGITLTPERPRFDKLLNAFVTSMGSRNGKYGAFVGVCGPRELSKGLDQSLRRLDMASKRAIGGIEFHDECVIFATNKSANRYEISTFVRVFGW